MIDFKTYDSKKAGAEGEPGAGGAEGEPGADGAEGEGATAAQHRKQRAQKPNDKEQEAKMRALNIGSQLYQMDVVMRMCAELQRRGKGGGVTEKAQEELSGRSAARRRKKRKAGRNREVKM